MQKLGANGVGKSFFVYKLANIDVSLARCETKVAKGHKGFSVCVTNDTFLASSRRDFSLNSIMINLFDFSVLDSHNGLEALRQKRLCLINETAFKEDSLRVLRAVSFVSRFGFSLEKNTKKTCQKIPINDLSKERIFIELEKFWQGKHLSKACKLFFDLGLFEKIFNISLNTKQVAELRQFLKTSTTKYDFLYFLSFISNTPYKDLLNKINAPNEYYKVFKYQLPPNARDLDLLELSLKIKLNSWLGLRLSNFEKIAKKLNIFDDVFKPSISPADLIKKGLSGKELGEELNKIKIKELKENYEKQMGFINRNNR